MIGGFSPRARERWSIISRMAEIEKGWAAWPLPAYSTVLTPDEAEWLALNRELADSLAVSRDRPAYMPPQGRSPLCGCLTCGCLKRYCNCSCCCAR